NNIETEAACEIRPGIVVRHKARGLIRREIALPGGQFSLQVGKKTVAPSKCILCIVRGYPRNCLSHRSGDQFGIFWIEPVVRVGETMGVTVASARIESAALHLKKRYPARGIDVTRRAPRDRRIAMGCDELVEPVVVSKSNADDD